MMTTPDPSRSYVLQRVFEATPESLWAAWTDPQRMPRWWGPHDFTNPVCDLDVRPGGGYRIVMRGQDGEDYPLKGVYQETSRPTRLAMTVDCSEHPESWHQMLRAEGGDMNGAAGRQTVTFSPQGRQTLLTVTMDFDTVATRDALLSMGMAGGWGQSMERLEDLLRAPEQDTPAG